ncbi:MAG: patatin-like phospholipase family protein [Nitrospiraceae bacterium]
MRQRGKLALALSGGGFIGYLFEIGALTALDDLFEDGFTINDFDLFLGVSAGAAGAALMANGVKPEKILDANLCGERPYYFERRDIFAPAMGEGLKTFLRAVQQLVPLLKLYARNRKEMSLIDLLEKAQESLPCGVYTLEPFARYLEATFAAKGLSNDFEQLRKELYIPAIDLESGRNVIFGEEGWRQTPISRAITASSAAPIYFCPVRIEGRDYIDAGIGRIACFETAIQKGADFMVIVHPHLPMGMAYDVIPPVGGSSSRIRHRGFLSIGDQASRINLEARFSLAAELYQRQHPDTFFVISPKPSETMLLERSFLSFRDRVYLLRCGYLSVAEAIMEQFERLQGRFAAHGIAISLSRIEERMRIRMAHLSGAAEAPIPALATAQGRVGLILSLLKGQL